MADRSAAGLRPQLTPNTMRGMRPWLAIAVVVAAACNDSAPGRGAPPRDPVAERAAAWSATSPPPARACQSDADCGVFPVVPGDDPCCDVTVTALPMSVRYMQASAEWRKRNCTGVACASPARPGAEPASCAFTPRCASGTCDNACDEVDAGGR